MSFQNRREAIGEECIHLPAWWGVFLIKPRHDAARRPRGRSAVSRRQFVCRLSAGVSPPATSFSRGRWAGWFFLHPFRCHISLYSSREDFFCKRSYCTGWILNGFVVLTQEEKNRYPFIICSAYKTTPGLNGCIVPPPPRMVRRRPQVHQPQTAVCAVQVPLSNPGVQTHSPRTDFTLKNTGPYPNHNFFIWFEDARSLWFTRKLCHLCKPCFNSLQINTTALEYFCLWKQKTPESESNMKLLIHGGKSHLYF